MPRERRDGNPAAMAHRLDARPDHPEEAPQVSTTEKWVRYSADVDTLTEAWGVVMDHLDEFGGLPSIEIKPVYLADDDGFPFSHFDVVIAGVQ